MSWRKITQPAADRHMDDAVAAMAEGIRYSPSFSEHLREHQRAFLAELAEIQQRRTDTLLRIRPEPPTRWQRFKAFITGGRVA